MYNQEEKATPKTMEESGNQTDLELEHGECCNECKSTCKRNFWTSVLNAIIKIATIVLAGFGLQSFKDAE